MNHCNTLILLLISIFFPLNLYSNPTKPVLIIHREYIEKCPQKDCLVFEYLIDRRESIKEAFISISKKDNLEKIPLRDLNNPEIKKNTIAIRKSHPFFLRTIRFSGPYTGKISVHYHSGIDIESEKENFYLKNQ